MKTSTIRRTRSAVIGGAIAITAVTVGGLLPGGSTDAAAGTAHAIQTADSPSSGAPIAGGGSWIVNRADYYYIGRMMPGDSFDNEYTDGNNWHYGRGQGGVDICGWVMPGSMGADLGTTADSCSAATKATISHRLTVGKDYNAVAHQATDGSSIPANSACTLYYNYFHGSDFTSNGGHWSDAATGATSSSVQYRYTTGDGQAVVVRDPSLGWGFLPIGCVERPAALHNDND